MRKYLLTFAAVAITIPLSGQTFERRASLTGGSASGQGQCTAEVVVDGSAEVEVRGDLGILRNLSGQAPQWRRFECTSRMPANPIDFQFAGVDGRGTQQLIRDPRSGGVALVRLSDPQGGVEAYTFSFNWAGGTVYSRTDSIFEGNPAPGRRLATEEAIRVCEDAVRQQAMERFGTSDVSFPRSTSEDYQGGRDTISGTLLIRGSSVAGRPQAHKFSCSMNVRNGRLRAVNIDQQPLNRSSAPVYGDRSSGISPQTSRACERAVQNRITRDGYQRVQLGRMRLDDFSGQGDRILGTVTADQGNISDSFDFTCHLNAAGQVRSVEVNRR